MDFVDGKLVDIAAREIRRARVRFDGGVIRAIETPPENAACDHFLMPGFVDAHVHVESSMLTPSQFARVAVTHGTVATVSDPHEIANVLGVAGVRFMLDDGDRVPFKFWFGAPSCVPATTFETAGDVITPAETETLLDDPRIHYLAEMMNFPGVLAGDADVMAKIKAAGKRGMPVDGHAPGLRGSDAKKYFAAGITTDHECFTEAEAIDKLDAGAIVQIRQGSAARNFDALKGLIDRYPGRIMFCSDDKHPDELLVGHINRLCRDAVASGSDLYHVLNAACITPVQHYGMNVGQLRVGDAADFIEVESIEEFNVLRTFIDGVCVSSHGKSRIVVTPVKPINRFECSPKQASDFHVASKSKSQLRVIVAHDGLLTTGSQRVAAKVVDDGVTSDVDQDVLKIAVVNRYFDAPPAVGFVRGFGLRRGAIAGSVAHDSHNIIAVGCDDAGLTAAVNAVIDCRGGLAVVDGSIVETLSLPIAGLMSTKSCEEVAEQYQTLDQLAKHLGSGLGSPFMTLSFMGLLVIPSLKLSDRGLFDGDAFGLVSNFV